MPRCPGVICIAIGRPQASTTAWIFVDLPASRATDFTIGFRPKGGAEVATVEEVANLAVYVASPLSSATTGAALRVDGGVVDTIA
jgi:NAD(P)-dependent dehydrogenase (short-subunit alcohol dehydrogenase family)